MQQVNKTPIGRIAIGKTVQIENSTLIPLMLEYLEQGHTATFRLRGYSMRPFLENDRDRALIAPCVDVAVGDVVLAEVSPKKYVLHRVWKINGDNVVLLGDGNLTPEYCRRSDLRAKALGFYLGKSTSLVRVTDPRWLRYSSCWMRLLPVRRWILAVYRRLPLSFRNWMFGVDA